MALTQAKVAAASCRWGWYVSGSPATLSACSGQASSATLSEGLITKAPGVLNGTYLGETITLSSVAGASDARVVRFDIQSNYGDSLTGLSEVRFDGTVIPEPSTLAFALVIGGLGLTMRRRRQS